MSPDHPPSLIHKVFEERARKTPQGTALHEGDRSITFSDLQSRAERVAGGLRSRGIRRGSSVGLHLERSIDWVVGMLGILKANAAVVPLPPSHPTGWLQEILTFSALDAVIDHGKTPLDPSLAVDGVRMEELLEVDGINGEVTPGQPNQAAFVLCSSGSTGRPKMIVRSHQSFFHRLQWTWEQHPFGASEIGCQKAHMTTTHSIYELFEPLLSGIPVVIIPDEDVRNLGGFWDTIREREISRLLIVPSALRASLDMPGFKAPTLEVLVLMGEYLHPGLAKRTLEAFPAQTRIFSIYGSTEASSTLVCDLRASLRAGEELPLGNPLSPDVRPFVLGPDLQPVPPGEAGRLHMGGSALFTEYFGDPDLTASAVVHAPGHAEPLYDTQDQVRLLPSGGLEFIGRVGDTVKVRGFRVDLKEVERAILSCPGVSQATVAVTDRHSGVAALVGFFVPNSVDRSTVFGTLRERLPNYMVPSSLVPLDGFPLTASGKVDRVRLLDEQARQVQDSDRLLTLSGTERRIKEVWGRTLGHTNFELDDSFFEVGGDSLSVFTLVYALHDAFGLEGDQLTEQSIYRATTIETLAARIDGITAGSPGQLEERNPLLVTLRRGTDPGQAPLFFISSAGGTLGAYGKLAKELGTSRELIGVRDPFNWGERDPEKGFGHWVDLFLDAIRKRQPAGPYYVCAYSSAGAFGYEIARRLREDAQEVALLALVDPLALDRSTLWRYGYWALRATYMRPLFRETVRIWGWLRGPAVRMLRVILPEKVPKDRALSAEAVQEITESAAQSKGHIRTFSALLELNTGLPFALSEGDLSDASPEQYISILEEKARSLTPDVDTGMIARIAVQYGLQVRAQHAYELRPYDGYVFLAEPVTRYAGITEAQLRPYVKRLQATTVEMGPPSERTLTFIEQFGSLVAHYRSMRDDTFVQGLAKEMDALLI